MAITDRRGLPLLTTSEVAAEQYCDGVDRTMAAWPGATACFEAAVDADPDFAMAQAALARQLAMSGKHEEARATIMAAAALAGRNATERERSHIAVLSLVIHGQSAEALEHALAHADTWPRDAVILSLPLGAFGLFAFSGMRDHDQARVDLCNRHAKHYDRNDWWFLTSRGWAEAENGDTTLGRAMLSRAFDLRRENANTVHGWAHALFEAGAGAEGEQLISDWLPSYDRTGVLHGHLAWHAALIALDNDDPDKALAIYEQRVQPKVSSGLPINVVSDAASFLWRVEAYGHDLPLGHWPAVAEYAARAFPRAGHAFVDTHMALIEAASGDVPAVLRRVETLADLVETGKLGAGAVVPALCRAALAFAEQDYEHCARILEPAVADVARIGGSGAQRQLLEDMLLVAQMRRGEAAKARAMLNARLHRRPSPRDSRWLSALEESVA